MDDILGSTVAQPLSEYIATKVAHEMAINLKFICVNVLASTQSHGCMLFVRMRITFWLLEIAG